MPSTPPISPRSSMELQRLHQPTPSGRPNSASSGTSTASTTPQTPNVPHGSDALPAEPRHGSTHALLSRRSGAKPATQPDAHEPEPSTSDELADGATIVQPGNPTALLMNMQQIQTMSGMVQSGEQGFASMTTSASRSAVDAVQDISA